MQIRTEANSLELVEDMTRWPGRRGVKRATHCGAGSQPRPSIMRSPASHSQVRIVQWVAFVATTIPTTAARDSWLSSRLPRVVRDVIATRMMGNSGGAKQTQTAPNATASPVGGLLPSITRTLLPSHWPARIKGFPASSVTRRATGRTLSSTPTSRKSALDVINETRTSRHRVVFAQNATQFFSPLRVWHRRSRSRELLATGSSLAPLTAFPSRETPMLRAEECAALRHLRSSGNT